MIPAERRNQILDSAVSLIQEKGLLCCSLEEVAKRAGVKVEEFGIGFPPRLYGRKFGETVYSINWIPFGGFNKLSGEVDPTAPRALATRSCRRSARSSASC